MKKHYLSLRMYSTYVLYALLILVFSSCEPDQDIISTPLTSSPALLNTDQIDFVGDMHNQLLEQVFENYDYSNAKWRNELEIQFSSLNITGLNPDYSLGVSGLEKQKIDFLNQLSPPARNIILEVIDESIVMSSVDSFEKFVGYKEALATRTLIGTDLTSTLIFLNVIRKSARFWMPKEFGGNGVGFQFALKLNPNHSYNGEKAPPWVKRALTADGISAAVGFVGAAVLVAATVGTGGIATAAIVATLVSIAGESGASSAIAIGVSP